MDFSDIQGGLQHLVRLMVIGSIFIGFIFMGINRTIENEQGGKGEGRMMASFYAAAAFGVAYFLVGLMQFEYGG